MNTIDKILISALIVSFLGCVAMVINGDNWLPLFGVIFTTAAIMHVLGIIDDDQ
jgi:hypothetical protein